MKIVPESSRPATWWLGAALTLSGGISMDYLYAGLAGVVVGAFLATVIVLYLVQKRVDRDLIERRLRACLEYRELVGALEGTLARESDDPAVVDQAWWGVRDLCREFRLTSWLLEPSVRRRLALVVAELEEELAGHERNGHGGSGRAAQMLCGKYHQLDRLLARETERQSREFHRFRFLPRIGSHNLLTQDVDE